MKVNGINNQNFGLNPSNALRTCIVKAGLEGADIRPLRKIIGELYPYKYMEMLGDYNKVQGINITDFYGAKPRIEKILPQEWQSAYDKHKHHDFYSRFHNTWVDEEGMKIWNEHAHDDVIGGTIIYKDLEGKKGFKDIIKILTSKLEEIRAKQDPMSRAMDEFNRGLPEYRYIPSKETMNSISSVVDMHRPLC